MQEYHHIWMENNDKSEDWLQQKLSDGFHIHHIDFNRENNAPENLVLIYGADHMRIHRAPIAFFTKAGKLSSRTLYEAPCGCVAKRRGIRRTISGCDGYEYVTTQRRRLEFLVEELHAGADHIFVRMRRAA